MAFLIGGAQSSADVAYSIENSLRYNDPDNPTLKLDIGSDGDRRAFTISMWVKRSHPTERQVLFYQGDDNGNSEYVELEFQSTGDGAHIGFFAFQSSAVVLSLVTTGVYRDPSAWYHIVANVDTEQGTAADRASIYINGEKQTSFTGTAVYPDEDLDLNIGNNADDYIIGGAAFDKSVDGYLADVAFVDGTQYAASTFGETDSDSGIWKPKEPSVTWGSNGFFLEFKQSGTGTDSSGMGADTSGNDNHLAPANLAATDQTTDTPTNNFCTLNPLVNSSFGTATEGNTRVGENPSDNNFAWGTMAGKMDNSDAGWYFELKLNAAGNVTGGGDSMRVGVGDFDYANVVGIGTVGAYPMTSDTWKGIQSGGAYTAPGHYFLMDNGGANTQEVGGGVDSAADHIVQVAWKDSKVFIGVNNTYYAADGGDDGDPANGTNQSHDISSTYNGNNWIPSIASSLDGAEFHHFNFGNPSFSISSGNTDANGYGNFEHAPPSGFYALCTKNLAEFG